MKIFTRLSELHMAKFGQDSIGCINKEIVLPALTCDSLRFIFYATRYIVNWKLFKRNFLGNRWGSYMKPIEMQADVLEKL